MQYRQWKRWYNTAGKIACCWERSNKVCYTTKCTLDITFSTRIASGEIHNGENLYTLFEYIDNLYMYIFTIFWQ